MILGRERDGVFIGDESIHVYEFTIGTDKAKAQKDGHKLVEALDHLAKQPGNRLKSLNGWFVTMDEPTAHQADAVRSIAHANGKQLHAISFATLRKRICDVEGYIAARDASPFGGAHYTNIKTQARVEPLLNEGGENLNIPTVAVRVLDGERFALTGEFGVGKSFAAEQVYRRLRKLYFRNTASHPFPIHINLRDCAGLRSPAEILRRHAEEIGYGGERGLMSAWRSGSCTLILDGFDEIIPNRLVGAATNLRQVRWEALSPVRRLVEEAPVGTGVFVTGRSHYFNTQEEMLAALGLPQATSLALYDFTNDQVSEFLRVGLTEVAIPDWLPTRPLFLANMGSAGMLEDLDSMRDIANAAQGWRFLLERICAREASIYTSMPPETIHDLLKTLAVRVRSREAERGELNLADMEAAFYEVSTRRTDEEALQMLLRLPGLAVAQSQNQEVRRFADDGIAAAAYGEALSDYICSPYQGHELCDGARWSSSGDELAIGVGALTLASLGIKPAQVAAAADFRMSRANYDAVLLDTLRIGDALGPQSIGSAYQIESVIIDRLEVSAGSSLVNQSNFISCVLSDVDFGQYVDGDDAPTFNNCLIGHVSGIQEVPSSLRGNLGSNEIESFDESASTTRAILALESLSPNERVELSILHKIYVKRGSGRKDSALYRGISPAERELVGPAIEKLLVANLMKASGRGSTTIYLPVREKRADVLKALESTRSEDLERLFN
ncbi:hypothetical protein AB0O99_12355 [Cellulosimicrobium funkei]|uniref:NACHT domain-containing protein n=1 Tax=Cellulosimicrobium funkei TaxID=264251 RepID=UPI00343280F6